MYLVNMKIYKKKTKFDLEKSFQNDGKLIPYKLMSFYGYVF